MNNVELGFPPNWNRDPRTGTVAPLRFGKTLNYRDESLVGDIKYLWEPNRHLELVALGQAFHLSGDLRYAEGVRTLLLSWFKQCPYPLGPNWTSSLEHAVRLVNWSVAWHLLGGEHSAVFAGKEGEEFRHQWLESIYRHCAFIASHFSRYSSANNHLLGEYMGLFVASVTWPLWQKSAAWQKLSKQGFEQEALKQNARDGVNREQGIWYHHEVADMMLICGLVGKANGINFSPSYWERLEAMLEFIASVMDVAGRVPMIGDSDDAVMVRFAPRDVHVYRSLLATGAVLFKRADFKAKAGDFDDKSRWLLGREGEEAFHALAGPVREMGFRRAFPEGGYYIFGSQLDTQREVRLVADSGPMGYLSIAAHGHADALACTLSVAGREILVDPGTYAYHTQKVWRDYFRGTAAHNTVRVDGLDQSVSGGNFLWLRHARARCLEFRRGSEQDIWSAEHDGYQRLSDPVMHQRTISHDKLNALIEITDRLVCRKRHTVEIHWHFSEECQLEVKEFLVTVRNSDVVLQMAMPHVGWQPEVVMGRIDPPLGWISRSFDVKVPAPCVRWSGEIQGTSELVTRITILG
ncbi:alginate lyase family protein [Thiohalobacter sp. IOR34]|uniref:alginate lyase family protein n=1 Tax=Thiohalobacter sp. IOR34 TaxID=3057176 RepID=UPI0025B1D42D|nr:alginate lyase family protein [Thiohalobacter sp. IOR34]WJW75297.1 alginate lyase family protein [Thiohalobacter sp. IOR34]